MTAEIRLWEAERTAGGHCAIRNSDLRLFWWAALAGADETTWERFWSKFPKHLRNKCAHKPCIPYAQVHTNSALMTEARSHVIFKCCAL